MLCPISTLNNLTLVFVIYQKPDNFEKMETLNTTPHKMLIADRALSKQVRRVYWI